MSRQARRKCRHGFRVRVMPIKKRDNDAYNTQAPDDASRVYHDNLGDIIQTAIYMIALDCYNMPL